MSNTDDARAESGGGDHHESLDKRLIPLLLFVDERQNQAKEEYKTSESPLTQFEDGRYKAYSEIKDELRDLIQSMAPECEKCDHPMRLKRDRRTKSGYRWECKLHPEAMLV